MDDHLNGDVGPDDELSARIQRVRKAIAGAAIQSGRRPEDVMLVAVSKTVGPDRVLAAARLGLAHFGENRVQEAEAKAEALGGLLPPGVQWHLIGHLQSNKARKAARLFSTIESVDTLDLATTLSRLAAELGKTITVLLEVNVGGEVSKYGFSPEALVDAAPRILELPLIEVRGLMTVAPEVSEPEQARPYFRRLRELRDRLQAESPSADLRVLSMGMTGDYPVAIQEGATLVRVGRAIFGERKK